MPETRSEYGQPEGCEAALSAVVDSSCKLPLLDGDEEVATRPIVTEVELEQSERLLQSLKQARGSLGSIICTAWSLLLRCYTGQDHVCFQLTWDDKFNLVRKPGTSVDDESFFRMDFQEEELLSTYVLRAMTSYSLSTQGSCMALPTTAKSRPWNSSMCMQDNRLSEKLGHNVTSQMTAALEPPKVNPLLPCSCD